MPTRYPSATPIRSWGDGYAALRRRAGDTRGWIELDSDAPDRRWPRTTGLDAILIASFLDDAFRGTDQAAYAGTALRWATCLRDLERDALLALGETYRGSRELWPCFAMMCAHLAFVGAPLPPQSAWNALLAELGALPPRNASPAQDRPPVWFAGAGSLDKLYLAQRTYLANLRGSDRMAPEGDMTGGVMPIPRTTNGEVLQLAEFWTQALDEPKARAANGYDTVRARWSAVQRDIEATARGADPNAVYPRNHAFWRAVSSVAIHVAASLEYGLSAAERWMAGVGESVQGAAGRAKELASSIGAGARDLAADAAHGAGKVLHEGARGLFDGIGTPLLIGGGIVAAILLLRSRREPAHAEAAS